jgi:hypothetical protein
LSRGKLCSLSVQLVFRLDSGWSFYTNRQQTGKKLSIKEDEIGTIEAIIKKKEEVTLREEYRIG